MVEILHTTPAGHLTDVERETVTIYGYEDAAPHRETARIAVPDGEVHLDVYRCQSGEQPKGTVVFVGGMGAHALQYATFLARLAAHGWNVVAFDARGHGRSSGTRGDFTVTTLLDDARGAVGYAHEQFDGPVTMMGSSLGGYFTLVMAGAIEEIDLAVSHWIFDPNRAVTPKDRRMRPVALTLNRISPRLKLPTKGLANWDAVNQDPELRERMYRDPLMVWRYSVRALAAGMTYSPARPLNQLRVPHLVVIGEADEMTPFDYTKAVFEWLEGDKTFKSIPGAGHMGGLNEHQDEMLAIVDDWLTARVASLAPSAGAVVSG